MSERLSREQIEDLRPCGDKCEDWSPDFRWAEKQNVLCDMALASLSEAEPGGKSIPFEEPTERMFDIFYAYGLNEHAACRLWNSLRECVRFPASPPPAPEAVRLLREAREKMQRARDILTDGNPTRDCNWGLLDVSEIDQFLSTLPT